MKYKKEPAEISKILAIKVMKNMSLLEKFNSFENEARELICFNPGYALYYLKKKFNKPL